MKMMKQEQRKVTQEMLKIFTLWRKNINLGERLTDGSVSKEKYKKDAASTNSLPCSGNCPIKMSLAVAFAMLRGSKDISSK